MTKGVVSGWGVDLRLRRITSSQSQTLRRRLVWMTDAAVSVRLDAVRRGFIFHTSRHCRHVCSEARYSSRISFFAYLTCIQRPRYGGSRLNIAIQFGTEKLEWLGYPMVKKFRKYLLAYTSVPKFNFLLD